MSVVLFVGPSLPAAERAEAADFLVLPPVAQGDLYRAACDGPRAIGIVDGYFEGVPAVWHKEILWAMAQGIHVFGSASMGALRAAELQAFGMRGVGEIFESYRDGILEDDDEVAVLHGPAEMDYMALSEPMVTIRATLAQAMSERVIAAAAGAALERAAKGMFYQERTWDALLAEAAACGLTGAEQTALADWLPGGRVDLKARDARAMVGEMRTFLAGDPAPAQVDYAFEWTDMWDIAVARAQIVGADPGQDTAGLPVSRLLDEARLDPQAYDRTARDALFRLLADKEAGRQGLAAGEPALGPAVTAFRARHGLFRQADLDRWRADNDLSQEAFEQLLAADTRITALRRRLAPSAEGALLDQLRITDRYRDLTRRALAKHEVLSAAGLAEAGPEDSGLMAPQLVRWFFEQQLGTSVPEDLDDAAAQLGLSGRAEFYRLLAREHIFLRLRNEPPDNDSGG